MKDSVWRPRARIVAIVELVLVTLAGLIISVRVALAGVGLTRAAINGTLNSTLNEVNLNLTHSSEPQSNVTFRIYWVLGIYVVVTVAVIVLQIWAAVKLLDAGRVDQEPATALDMALLWRNVTIVLSILSFIGNLVQLNIPGLIILIIWRGISFYVVFKFIGELRSFLSSGNSQPDSVVYGKNNGNVNLSFKEDAKSNV